MKYIFPLLAFVFSATPLFLAHAADTLQDRFLYGEPIKILIVPGHDDESSGAEFKGVREADLTLVVANKIRDELAKNPALVVTVVRDGGWYIPDLEKYFKEYKTRITRFISQRKKTMQRLVEREEIEITEQVTHGTAAADVAKRLYGINMWADKNKFDFVIHVHFNDYYPRKSTGGEFGGYTVYVPEKGLLNARKSLPLAQRIATRLNQFMYPTNAPSEMKKTNELGIAPDMNLIALGANRTLVTPSVLVEYSYIYEPHIVYYFEQSSDLFARATAQGILDFLKGTADVHAPFIYEWGHDMKKTKKTELDVLMLQFAMKNLGYFPPDMSSCDRALIDGVYGDCTVMAVKSFQRAKNLTADGMFGKQSRALLNAEFKEPVAAPFVPPLIGPQIKEASL